MDYDAFFQELKQGKIRPLYLFEGEEEYTKESALKALRQQVVRGPSFTGWGKRPVLTPAHHAERDTGTRCSTPGRRRRVSD